MNARIKTWIAMTLFLAVPIGAGEDDFERIVLRVVSSDPTGAAVDRGSRDGLEVGDTVEFFPRQGGVFRGSVSDVKDRTAFVRIDDPKFQPDAGTRGEVLIPRARLAADEPDPDAPDDPDDPDDPDNPDGAGDGSGGDGAGGTGKPTEGEDVEVIEDPDDVRAKDHPDWKNKDENYKKGKPLLAEVRPVRPNARDPKYSGRAYAIGAITSIDSEFDASLFRIGTDILLENLFKRGGRIRFNTEMNFRTETSDQFGVDLLVRRASYAVGGTRFEPVRWEAGRFLHHAVPEFGVIDGFEWSKRNAKGHRFGASIGFLPTPTDDFDTLEDFSFSVFYRWIADLEENFSATIGFQKTWHNGEPDRDLILLKSHYHRGAWDLHGTLWIDLYTGGDDIKGSGLELTQAILQARRRWDNGSGVNITFLHLAFPELLRNEFLPLLAAEIDANRLDRLSVEFWWDFNDRMRAHTHGRIWDDEDQAGGAGEFGFEIRDFPFRRLRGDITAFATAGQFEDTFGFRVTFGRQGVRARWDVLYEVANHHLLDFPPDVDDLIQHRVRFSTQFYFESRWDLSSYVEVVSYDTEINWTLGFTVQRRF